MYPVAASVSDLPMVSGASRCDSPARTQNFVFLRALQVRQPAVVLLGPNGRVIASNNARIATGTLLSAEDSGRAEATLDVSAGTPSRLPWKLISLHQQAA